MTNSDDIHRLEKNIIKYKDNIDSMNKNVGWWSRSLHKRLTKENIDNIIAHEKEIRRIYKQLNDTLYDTIPLPKEIILHIINFL